MKQKITDLQERFCREYVIDLNARQAAIRAGYSENSANEQASRLLTKVNIQAFISELKKKVSERTDISADMVVLELAKIGFSNIQDYIKSNNLITDISQIDKNKAASVSMIKTEETIFNGGTKTTVLFKLYDKVSALEKLGRHLGIFEADNKQLSNKVKIKVTTKKP